MDTYLASRAGSFLPLRGGRRFQTAGVEPPTSTWRAPPRCRGGPSHGPALCRIGCPDAPRVSPWCVLAPRSVFTALRRAQDRVEPVRRRALPFKAEGVLDPGHARAADDGRGAGAFRARIAAHTAPTRRAARAPKASQPQGQTLNGTVRAMLGAAAGGALRLCRARKHGLGTPTRTARTAPNASRLARAQSLPTLRPDPKRNGARHVGRGCPRCVGAVLCRARTD